MHSLSRKFLQRVNFTHNTLFMNAPVNPACSDYLQEFSAQRAISKIEPMSKSEGFKVTEVSE